MSAQLLAAEQQREQMVEEVHELRRALNWTEAYLDEHINVNELVTGGIDSLSFVGLDKLKNELQCRIAQRQSVEQLSAVSRS